jgi:hypothetical protein
MVKLKVSHPQHRVYLFMEVNALVGMTNDEPSARERIFFEQIQDTYNFQHRISNSLDTSAANLVGWNGLILSVLLTGGGILISRGTTVTLDIFEYSLLSVVLVGLAVSLSIAIFAFRRGSYEMINASSLIRSYDKAGASTLLHKVGGTMVKATEYNSNKNARRDSYISVSQTIFLMAMILATIFLIIESHKLIV